MLKKLGYTEAGFQRDVPLEARRKGELMQDAFALLVRVHGKARIVADVIEEATPGSAERRLLMAGLLEAGSKGYVLKEESPTSLLFAIRAVAGGQTWLSSRVARMLVSKAVATWGPPTVSQDLAALTEREQEVLALIGRGLSNQEIAEVLCVACGTVHTHVNRIYGKIGLDRRSQAVRYAMTHGLVSVPPEE